MTLHNDQLEKLSDDNAHDFAAASVDRHSRADQLEVKVARVEEKIDALRERFGENFEALIKLIEDHTEADNKALAAQLEQNRLLQEKLNEVDDFRKKLQYGTIAILGLIGTVWAIVKVALMVFTNSK